MMQKTEYPEEKYYVLVRNGKHVPVYEHSTLESAEIEAIKLTAKTQKKVWVIKKICSFYAPDPRLNKKEKINKEKIAKENKIV